MGPAPCHQLDGTNQQFLLLSQFRKMAARQHQGEVIKCTALMKKKDGLRSNTCRKLGRSLHCHFGHIYQRRKRCNRIIHGATHSYIEVLVALRHWLHQGVDVGAIKVPIQILRTLSIAALHLVGFVHALTAEPPRGSANVVHY